MRTNAYRVAVTIEAPPHNVGLRMKAGHLIEADRTGSRVELSFEISGLLAPVIRRLYGGLIESYVLTESQKLQLRCESPAGSATGLGKR
jgi:hypothetical protein